MFIVHKFKSSVRLVHPKLYHFNFSTMATFGPSTSTGDVIAVAQMNSTNSKTENLETCKTLISRAVEQGAKMVFLPEACDYIGNSHEETESLAEPLNGPWVKSIQREAESKKIWVSLGGFHEKLENGRLRNAQVIINSQGEITAVYRKVHLFDVNFPEKGVVMQESKYIEQGTEILPPVSTPFGKIGLAICYDVRFPEMSIKLTQAGAQILTYPSAFMFETGANHWEALLKCRALENLAYVVAAAQTGAHGSKRKSWGHASIIDPYGSIIAQCSEGTNLAFAKINLDYVETLRKSIPVWSNRRFDLYPKLEASHSSDALQNCKNIEFTFGQVKVPAEHVFFKTQLTIAFVNKKCVVPGHVLVAPIRLVTKFHEMSDEEVADLFQVVKRVEKVMEQKYKTDSSTLCIQDGIHAGQTIRHVHVHILPRVPGDFAFNDDIYKELQNHDKVDKGWRNSEEMTEESNSLRPLFS
ncbi:unnamed protein product [Bemisia tabaci]|uniref:bis(5'-adenosyl)-triphosphatase n=2 Tax=Bemisia tabaci TaxID=7038 RepID=A0A9P0AK75_BEMTA|nr:unnamed protein product [Bemisia tabaci]